MKITEGLKKTIHHKVKWHNFNKHRTCTSCAHWGCGLLSTPSINTVDEKVLWIEHQLSFISRGGCSSITFHISGTGIQYSSLTHTECYIKLKI